MEGETYVRMHGRQRCLDEERNKFQSRWICFALNTYLRLSVCKLNDSPGLACTNKPCGESGEELLRDYSTESHKRSANMRLLSPCRITLFTTASISVGPWKRSYARSNGSSRSNQRRLRSWNARPHGRLLPQVRREVKITRNERACQKC